MKTQEENRAKDQARAQLNSIVEMLAIEDEEKRREAIDNDPLSVEVRTDWYTPGNRDNKPTEYKILLCTGGPACQIVGELSEFGQPETAILQYQDWFTQWEDYRETTEAEDEALIEYANYFYYEE